MKRFKRLTYENVKEQLKISENLRFNFGKTKFIEAVNYGTNKFGGV